MDIFKNECSSITRTGNSFIHSFSVQKVSKQQKLVRTRLVSIVANPIKVVVVVAFIVVVVLVKKN